MKLTKAYDIKSRLTEELLRNSGKIRKSFSILENFSYANFIGDPLSSINGIGLGLNNHREYYVKVYTEYNISFNKQYIADVFGVTTNEIIVSNVGVIKPFASTSNRIRPAYPGTSIAHYKVTSGTFGCVVQDDDGDFYILSNNHVLANSNHCKIGDAILQPGAIDGGILPGDHIANLFDYVPLDFNGINSIDAAIAKPIDLTQIQSHLPVIGRIKGVSNPRTGMSVAKFGRTTGYTTGIVTARGVDIKVNFGANLLDFEDQFEIISNNNNKPFSSGGDSGSIIIDLDTKEAVGLLFAGTMGSSTFANPIMTVLNNFDIKIV